MDGEAGLAHRHASGVARRTVLAVLRGLALVLLAPLGLPLFVLRVYGLVLAPLGLGMILLAPASAGVRALANLNRRLVSEWTGVQIPVPYRPRPWPGRGPIGQVKWIITDPASWRDQLWLLVNPYLALAVAGMPAALVAAGLWGFVLPFVWRSVGDGGVAMYSNGQTPMYLLVPLTGPVTALLAIPMGAVTLMFAAWAAPRLLWAYGRATHALLAPTRRSELANRVQRLTQTRADAVDSQAAELRRIERDLHDGAQARLVAMGMNLGAAERLLADAAGQEQLAAARALLAEARESSTAALQELRNLVRGIHPPVLADRGLGDAVRALALASPMPVEVRVDLPGRFEAPVESAAYFAVAEVLTNAIKHAGGGQVWVDLRYLDGALRMAVTDDGRGGADVALGTGLRGVQLRLGTFDGVLVVDSPLGGPTVVMMELPCVLSSPKISSS